MLVRATAQGYFDGFREKGDEFTVPDGREAPWWVSAETQPEENTGDSPPESFSEMNARNVAEDKAVLERKTRKPRG